MIVALCGTHIPIWVGNDELLIASLGFYFSSDTSQELHHVLEIKEHNLFQEAWKSSSAIQGVSKSLKLGKKHILLVLWGRKCHNEVISCFKLRQFWVWIILCYNTMLNH